MLISCSGLIQKAEHPSDRVLVKVQQNNASEGQEHSAGNMGST